MSDSWHSIHTLHLFRLNGLPRSQKGIRERAQREGWLSREVPGKGGPGGTRIEYQAPPEVQAQIDEIEKHRAREPAARYEVPASTSPAEPGRIDRDLLVEISVKLERAFLSSDAVGVRFGIFIEENREAVEVFMRSLREPKAPGDVHVGQLLAAVAGAWKHHAALHAIVAADIYNQAVVMTGHARRTRFIDDEVESFVRVNSLLLSTPSEMIVGDKER